MNNEPQESKVRNAHETLFGGRTIAVQYDDGHTEDVKVLQLPIGKYEKAFALLDDEIGLTALCCGKNRDWLCRETPGQIVLPESYERLWAAIQEVNSAGFFEWSTRRAKAVAEKNSTMVAALAALPPDMIRMAVEKGLQANGSTSAR